MRKPGGVPVRALSALFIVWFGLTASGPLPIDLCPMHETHSASGTSAHAMHHGLSRGGEIPAPGQKSARRCTCPSECGGAGGKAVLADEPLTLPAGRTIAAIPSAWNATAVAPRATAFLIPFANGPPTNS